MKNQNPPKKLSFIKKTIAHLNIEQMDTAKAGGVITQRLCNTTITNLVETADCDTIQYLDTLQV